MCPLPPSPLHPSPHCCFLNKTPATNKTLRSIDGSYSSKLPNLYSAGSGWLTDRPVDPTRIDKWRWTAQSIILCLSIDLLIRSLSSSTMDEGRYFVRSTEKKKEKRLRNRFLMAPSFLDPSLMNRNRKWPSGGKKK